MSIGYFDQHGNPMAPAPTPDAPPQWTQANPAADTLTPAPDGNSATALGLAAGSDTISLSLTVGGATFSATLDLTVSAEPQVLTSIQIVPGAPA